MEASKSENYSKPCKIKHTLPWSPNDKTDSSEGFLLSDNRVSLRLYLKKNKSRGLLHLDNVQKSCY
jgi:hypothetical protein